MTTRKQQFHIRVPLEDSNLSSRNFVTMTRTVFEDYAKDAFLSWNHKKGEPKNYQEYCEADEILTEFLKGDYMFKRFKFKNRRPAAEPFVSVNKNGSLLFSTRFVIKYIEDLDYVEVLTDDSNNEVGLIFHETDLNTEHLKLFRHKGAVRFSCASLLRCGFLEASKRYFISSEVDFDGKKLLVLKEKDLL